MSAPAGRQKRPMAHGIPSGPGAYARHAQGWAPAGQRLASRQPPNSKAPPPSPTTPAPRSDPSRAQQRPAGNARYRALLACRRPSAMSPTTAATTPRDAPSTGLGTHIEHSAAPTSASSSFAPRRATPTMARFCSRSCAAGRAVTHPSCRASRRTAARDAAATEPHSLWLAHVKDWHVVRSLRLRANPP